MTEPLTPREHADVRDLLLAGSERMKPSGVRRALVPAAVAVVLVAGIVGTTVVTTFGSNTNQPAATPAPTGIATIDAQALIPAACAEYANSDADNAPGGDAIANAAETADLGPRAVLSPGIQVVESASNPGTFEATARVCGDALDRQELVAAATSIAKAIHADPAHAGLSTLVVAAWRPISSDAIAKDENLPSISTDYQAHDWDAASDLLATAWE